MRYLVYQTEDQEQESATFSTFEEAEEFATETGADYIAEEFGFQEFRPCWWCKEYHEDLNESGLCPHCEMYLRSRC